MITLPTDYGLALEADDIQTMQAYDRKDHILDRNLTEKEAHEHQVWLAFAGEDKDRLEKYVTKTFKFGRDLFEYDSMMGIYVPISKKPIEHTVVLNRVFSRSRADGCYLLGGNALFVGVRKKSSNDLEHKI